MMAGLALILGACEPEGGPDNVSANRIGAGDEAPDPSGAVQEPEEAPRDGVPDASSNAAQPAPGEETMRWSFNRTAAGPRLAYGEPQTDNVRLMMRCPPGGDSVLLSFHRPREVVEARPRELSIRSGGAVHRARVEARESQLGGMMVEAQAPVTAAPFRQMQAGNALVLRWGEETVSLPAPASARDTIATFFETCGPF